MFSLAAQVLEVITIYRFASGYGTYSAFSGKAPRIYGLSAAVQLGLQRSGRKRERHSHVAIVLNVRAALR